MPSARLQRNALQPSSPPDHVPCNPRLAHVDAEPEQFAVDAGRAPERVGQAHVSDRSPAAPPGLPTQNDRKLARCQQNAVSGRTMATTSTMVGARRYSPTNTNRSKVRKANLFGDLRRSTLICCRRTRISASSRTLERNKLVSAVHSSRRTSTIGHEHHHSPLLASRIGFSTRSLYFH
jgi:hypothetical protein